MGTIEEERMPLETADRGSRSQALDAPTVAAAIERKYEAEIERLYA